MKKIYYPYTTWEDYQNGLYKKGFTKEQEKQLIKNSKKLLTNQKNLYAQMKKASTKWNHSSEINLSNTNCNRQAWLGQAACCITFGCPEQLTKQAWHELTQKQKDEANKTADKVILEFEQKIKGETNNAQTTFKIKCL